jgi:hypothetical protein
LCNATFTPLLITSTSPIANTPGSDCLINTKRLGGIGTGAILRPIKCEVGAKFWCQHLCP